MPRAKLVMLLVVVGLTSTGAAIQRGVAQRPATTAKAIEAAKALIASLDERQRARVSLPLNATTRTVWSNLPSGITLQTGATERNGVKFGDLTAAQQDVALGLLRSVLSPDGFQKVMNIVHADQVLEERSAPTRAADARVRFGRAEFYIAILGTPSPTDHWIIQFGGHHLAINVTVAGAQNVLTPTHTGTQPASYTLDGQTIRPLGDEADKAFKLMTALDAAQQKQALLGYEVRNIVLGPGQDGKVIQPEGIRGSALNAAQRAMLVDLAREWIDILNADAARAKVAEVEANLGDTYFAWSGPTGQGQGAYFRIQGPTIVIEYAPQGKPPNDTDHIHTIYRDPTNDYAAKSSR
jgi:hypothetical protein